MNKISRPLLDRIDLCAEMKEIAFDELNTQDKKRTSGELQSSVENARKIQLERYRGTAIQFNSQINIEGIGNFCRLGKEEQVFMEQIYHKLELTARSYHRILKVARTIADLEGKENIEQKHLSEAVCYRMAEKKYWTR